MTLKDMFKKIENYNELAELMHVQKAAIHYYEDFTSKLFDNYKEFRKFVKHEHLEEVAAEILASNFEFDGTTEIKVVDRFDGEHALKIETDLVTVW